LYKPIEVLTLGRQQHRYDQRSAMCGEPGKANRRRAAPESRDCGESLSSTAATELAHRLTRDGTVAWSAYGLQHARAARMTTVECEQTLRAGVADPGEFKGGEWQYRIHWQRTCVVVVFRKDVEAVVVDAWRKSR
jgi:hypothetical protein